MKDDYGYQFPGLDPVIHHPKDVEMIHKLQATNADLLETLEELLTCKKLCPACEIRAKQAIENARC